MKTFRAVTISKGLAATVLKSTLSLVLVAVLAAGFWVASAPLTKAAGVTPAEALQSSLPAKTTLATAPRADVLSAVCKSINRNKGDAADIVRTAAGARRELASDIVSEGIRCTNDGNGTDCGLVRRILHAGTEADPANAARLTETVIALSPGCGLDGKDSKDAPAEGPGDTISNINPPPGSSAGGGGPAGCSVCHNGHVVTVACPNLDEYLRGHPGDTSGPCETTPDRNQ